MKQNDVIFTRIILTCTRVFRLYKVFDNHKRNQQEEIGLFFPFLALMQIKCCIENLDYIQAIKLYASSKQNFYVTR